MVQMVTCATPRNPTIPHERPDSCTTPAELGKSTSPIAAKVLWFKRCSWSAVFLFGWSECCNNIVRTHLCSPAFFFQMTLLFLLLKIYQVSGYDANDVPIYARVIFCFLHLLEVFFQVTHETSMAGKVAKSHESHSKGNAVWTYIRIENKKNAWSPRAIVKAKWFPNLDEWINIKYVPIASFFKVTFWSPNWRSL